MSRIIFIFLLFVAAIVRGPISLLLIILKNLIKPLAIRIEFERKNFLQLECRSFKLDLMNADYCFEVSSEGELEQVRPLIEYYLLKNKRIEILFSSPSVESKCLKLASDNKNQIRVMRIPLASFAPMTFLFFQSPWSWVSAPVIIFCRYDFFPELLSFKFLARRLVLLSAAGKKPSWFKNQTYPLFDLVVASSEVEAKYFRNQLADKKIFAFDFRVPRIFKRYERASQTLNKIPEITTYLNYLDSVDSSRALIMGSAWESDLVIFQNDNKLWINELLDGSKHLLIVPHKIDSESIMQLKNSLMAVFFNVPIYEINKGQNFEADVLRSKPGMVILNLSGVLCELYSKFSFAYVGGGYERSIHSVLEPFLSGCQVACGPKISRSTEYDYILELAPDEIHLLNNSESFYTLMNTFAPKPLKISLRTQLSKSAGGLMESIIKEIDHAK